MKAFANEQINSLEMKKKEILIKDRRMGLGGNPNSAIPKKKKPAKKKTQVQNFKVSTKSNFFESPIKF